MPHNETPRPLVLPLPALPDEIAVQMFELLQELLFQYETVYADQTRRVYRERDEWCPEQRALDLAQRAQQSLPLEAGPPF